MRRQHGQSKAVYLAWLAVAGAAVATGVLLHRGAGDLDLSPPAIGDGVAQLAAGVQALDERYAKAAAQLREFIDLWKLAALLIGAGAAAAAVLRAPQAVTVVLGAFSGAILGALQLFATDDKVAALQTARDGLACIGSHMGELETAHDASPGAILTMRDDLRASALALDDSVLHVESCAARLTRTLALRQERREAAVAAVESALASPPAPYVDALQQVLDARAGIDQALQRLASRGAARRDELVALDGDLARAESVLALPEQRYRALAAGLDGYFESVVAAEMVAADARRELDRADALGARIPGALTRLENWTQDLARATAAAHAAVSDVRAELAAVLGRDGASPHAVQAMLAGLATDLASASPAPADLLSRLSPVGSSPMPALAESARTPSHALSPQQAARLVERALASGQDTLERIAPDLQRAANEAGALRSVTTDHLAVLTGVQRPLDTTARRCETSVSALAADAEAAEAAMRDARAVLSRVDLPRLAASLSACAGARTAAVAPRSTAASEPPASGSR